MSTAAGTRSHLRPVLMRHNLSMDSRQRQRLNDHLRRHAQGLTLAEAEELGLSARRLQDMQRRGELARRRPGTYLNPSITPGFRAELDLAIRACKRPAFVARSAALFVHGFQSPLLEVRPEIVVVGSSLPLLGPAVTVHRTRQLEDIDTCRVAGIDTTTAERAVIDVAATLTRVQRMQLVDQVLFAGVANPDRLFERAEALQRGRPWVQVIRMITSTHGKTRFHSGLEKASKPLLIEAGLTDVRFNVRPLHAPDAGEMDAVSERHRMIVELDGLQYHMGGERRQRDNDKGNAVVAGNYRLLRFTYADVFERDRWVVGRVASLVDGRAAA